MDTGMANGQTHFPSATAQSMETQGNILEIFDLERATNSVFSPVHDCEEKEHTNPEDSEEQRIARAAYLEHVLPVLAGLWISGSDQFDLAAGKLADASRDGQFLFFAPHKSPCG
jgi:hypothetical protein